MPLEALIFDVDGTLAETEEVHRTAFNHAFAACGLDWIWSATLYRDLLRVTGGKERIRHYVENHHPPQAGAALAQLAAIHARKNTLYAELVDRGMALPRRGVARLIAEARHQGLRLAIATTTSPGNVEPLLRAAFGAASPSWFAVVAAGDCVAAKKPAPDIYQNVLDELNIDVARCIAFEDSQNGVVAARSAGLTVVATPSFYSRGDDFAAASTVVSDLGEPETACRQIAGIEMGALVDVAALRRLLDRTTAVNPPAAARAAAEER